MKFRYTRTNTGHLCIRKLALSAATAGLLGHLLHLKGIDSVILERRDHEYVIDRVRAGVLEQFTADLMIAIGVGDRLRKEGLRHDDVYISFRRPAPSDPAG